MENGHCGICMHNAVCHLRLSTNLPDSDVAHFCKFYKYVGDVAYVKFDQGECNVNGGE